MLIVDIIETKILVRKTEKNLFMSILLFALDSRPRPKQSYKTVVVRNATRATKQQISKKRRLLSYDLL